MDNDRLRYRWWQYKEPTATTMGIHFAPELKLEQSETMDARFVAPTVKTATPFHIILPVQDDGTPSLFAYRRAIVAVTP